MYYGIKKTNPIHWGLTIKKFDDKDEFTSQHTWKLTWLFKEAEGILAPSLGSKEFTEIIKGETVAKLDEIKNKYINKKK